MYPVLSSDFLLLYPKNKSTNRCSFQEIHFAAQFNVKPTHLVVGHLLTCSRYAHTRFDSWYWVIELTFESCMMVPLYHSKLSWLQCARVTRQNSLALWCLALPVLLRQNCMRATSPGLIIDTHIPYFLAHKTHFFPWKMWPKFDLHLMRWGYVLFPNL